MSVELDLPGGVVTFVMTDIEGSTRLFHELGTAYPAVLEDHNQLLRAAFSSHGGHEIATEGDSLFVSFAGAADAVAACLDAQRALAGHRWPDGVNVRVRIGVHTGEATPIGRGYVALAVHQLARISAGAHGGQIVLSAATVAAAGRGLPEGATVSDLGLFHLRGFPAPERLYQLRHPDLRVEFPPLRAIGIVSHNLPYLRTSFVGRGAEQAAVADLLHGTGVVTLVGIGGVGKTRLAVQVAFDLLDDYPDGAWMVALETVADPALVARSVAAAVKVAEQPGRPVEEVLIEALVEKRALVLLDSCEHLLDTVARLAERLSRRCPHLGILATSREPLDIDGETIWRLEPLATVEAGPQTHEHATGGRAAGSDAVRLFVERAALARPGFELTPATTPDVARIVAHLDGIPLAIELAAAALADRPLASVLGGLTDRFALLTGGRRTAPERHQTLRAALEWSLDLLHDEERTSFARLAAFAGGWTTAAAADVCGADSLNALAVPAILRRLARASLIVADSEIPDRWSMFETVRELAVLKLAASGEAAWVRARHRAWFVRQAEESEASIGRTGQQTVMQRLIADHDNLRRAVDTAVESNDAESALRLCAALGPFWMSHGDWTEGSLRLDAALSIAGGEDRLHGRALVALAHLLLLRGELPTAADRFAQARVAAEAARDKVTLARALAGLGHVDFRRSHLDEAEGHWRRGLAQAQRAGDERVAAGILRSLAIATASRGDQQGAGELLEQAIAMARRVHDDELLRQLLGSAAERQLWLGRYDEAARSYGDALEIASSIGDLSARPLLLAELGWVALLRGDLHTARRLSIEAAELAEDLGNRRILVHALRLKGEADARMGSRADAGRSLDRALEVAGELGAPAETAGVRTSQASLAADEGRLADAQRLAEAAQSVFTLPHPMRRTTPDWALALAALAAGDLVSAERHFRADMALAVNAAAPRHEANGVWGLGLVAQAAGRLQEAARHYGTALDIRLRIGDMLGVADLLVSVAALSAATDPEAAARLIGAAGAGRAAAGAVTTPREAVELDTAIAAVTDVTGAAGAEAGREAGAALDVRVAAQIALELCARMTGRQQPTAHGGP